MDKTVGIISGGQLSRMMLEPANNLGIKTIVLDENENCPANQINPEGFVWGGYKDPLAIERLASRVDVVKTTIEHVDVDMLRALANGYEPVDGGRIVIVQPHPSTIKTIQDKFLQKEYLLRRGIPVAKSVAVSENVAKAIKSIGGCPVFLKVRIHDFDGRGNYALESESKIPEAVEALGAKRALYVEEWIPFRMELAVTIVKTQEEPDAELAGILAFPVVETVAQDGICKLVYLPPRAVDEKVLKAAQLLARSAVAGFGGKGVFGVEMFLLFNGNILINEIACRVHNAGHLTIESSHLSQFEAHLRAILDIPIDATSLEANRAAIMINILGCNILTRHLEIRDVATKIPRASIHLYGKASRPLRKLGHCTVTAKTMEEAEEAIQPLIDIFDRLRAERLLLRPNQRLMMSNMSG